MENRLLRNNIRVYGIPEEAEGKEIVPFLVDFLKTTLELQEDMEIKLELLCYCIMCYWGHVFCVTFVCTIHKQPKEHDSMLSVSQKCITTMCG